MTERYTPGHTQNATDFMRQRTLESHGAFFRPFLKSGMTVLDAGCGPGSITRGIAATVAPGEVVGIDMTESQDAAAQRDAHEAALPNVRLQTGSCYALPFADASFDAVFSHALMEHLAEPQCAVAEFHRVLKSGGTVGLCCPDWGGFLLAPPSQELDAAITAYRALQTRNGGNVFCGRSLGQLLITAGLRDVEVTARYECYTSRTTIAGYLALQLEQAGDSASAHVLRAWARQDGGLFAQAWVSAVGRKGEAL